MLVIWFVWVVEHQKCPRGRSGPEAGRSGPEAERSAVQTVRACEPDGPRTRRID